MLAQSCLSRGETVAYYDQTDEGHYVAVVERTEKRPLPWPLAFYQSDVGKKWIMAISGIALLGFVVAHMIGNLHIYQDAFHMNEYGEFLRRFGAPIFPESVFLWIFRAVLAGAFVVHLHAAYSLTRTNQKARPVSYQGGRQGEMPPYLRYASRTMRWSGTIVLLFIAWHLMDLTLGTPGIATQSFIEGKPYENVVTSFPRVPVAIMYIIANLALGFHIMHGAWSMFQSLGVNSPRINAFRRVFAGGLAALVVIGNVSFPVMVLTGVVS